MWEGSFVPTNRTCSATSRLLAVCAVPAKERTTNHSNAAAMLFIGHVEEKVLRVERN